ncbi:MAG: DUF3592 domain-containing protein [Candidatus Rifleibacteriota bacterium]
MAFGWGSEYSKYGIKEPDNESNLEKLKNNLNAAKICIALAVLMLLQHVFWLPVGFYSSYWPEAEGKIVSFKISEANPDWLTYFVEILGERYGEETHYGLDITYEYKVGGIQFFGSRVWMAPENTWDNKGSVPSETYIYNKPGKKIKVRYCPFKKDFSVLIPGPQVDKFFILGIIFLAIGLWTYSHYKTQIRLESQI